MVVNFLEEEVSIIGSEIFMNPAASEELTFGYFVSKDLDLLHVDFGITYLRLNTDTQQHAYVLKDGETDAPEFLKNALKKTGITSVLLSAWVEISARRLS